MKTLKMLVLLAGIELLVPHAYAWGPFAHDRAAPNDHGLFQNLPDLWLSRQDPAGTTYIGQEVSPYFGWSHACLRTGVVTVAYPIIVNIGPFSVTIQPGVVYPVTPTAYGVPAGIEKPGEDIYKIIKNKLMNPGPLKFKRTAQGFAGHNAADSVVHFSYFKGGSVYDWVAEHALKESLAEYYIYVGLGGDWNILGQPTKLWGMGCLGDANAINLAQKVFRKNRQTVDIVPDTTGALRPIVVETETQITNSIRAKHNELDNYVNGLSPLMFAKWVEIGQIVGWDATTLFTRYYQARAASAAAVNAMP